MRKTLPRPEDFPALRAFLRGYLGEDFPVLHGDEAGAAAAFLADASPAEKEELRREVRLFRQAVRGLPLRPLATLLSDGFGAAWAPGRRARVDALLDALERTRATDGGRIEPGEDGTPG